MGRASRRKRERREAMAGAGDVASAALLARVHQQDESARGSAWGESWELVFHPGCAGQPRAEKLLRECGFQVARRGCSLLGPLNEAEGVERALLTAGFGLGPVRDGEFA